MKAPGVTKDMVGRWQSKDGRLDCSSMDYVPFCGVSLEEKCGQTYTVQSGIGCILSLDIPCALSQPALTFPCLFLDSCVETSCTIAASGYKCNWNEAVWPPKCSVLSSTDPAKICMSGKCANDACW